MRNIVGVVKIDSKIRDEWLCLFIYLHFLHHTQIGTHKASHHECSDVKITCYIGVKHAIPVVNNSDYLLWYFYYKDISFYYK